MYICSHVQDSEPGDPDAGIEPVTKIEDLAYNWICPECGAVIEQFEREEEVYKNVILTFLPEEWKNE